MSFCFESRPCDCEPLHFVRRRTVRPPPGLAAMIGVPELTPAAVKGAHNGLMMFSFMSVVALVRLLVFVRIFRRDGTSYALVPSRGQESRVGDKADGMG